MKRKSACENLRSVRTEFSYQKHGGKGYLAQLEADDEAEAGEDKRNDSANGDTIKRKVKRECG